MMKAHEFEEAKRAIIDDMLKTKMHCANSVIAVRRCTGLREFVAVLNKFKGELKHKRFPNVNVLRKYFLGELDELNKLGIYIDQEVDITNQDVWLFGRCTGTVRSDRTRFFDIVINDDADIKIMALKYTLQRIYVKSPNEAWVNYLKANTATQIISPLDKTIWEQSTSTTEQAD